MAQSLKFTLHSIDINDTYVAPGITEAEVANPKDFSWQFSYDFTFAGDTESYEKVILHFWFELARDADDDVMTTLDVTNTFRLTAGAPNDVKLEILQTFFDMSITSLQGIFAALTERSPLTKLMLPDINSEHYLSNLEQIVHNDWWSY